MAAPKFSVNINSTTVLLLVGGLGAAYFIWSRDLLSKVNPADPNNFVNQAVIGAVGEEKVATAADYIFGAVDLINPFAPAYRREYAKKVYGG